LYERSVLDCGKKRFAFALDKDNHAVDEPSVLATVPMWFGLLDEANQTR